MGVKERTSCSKSKCRFDHFSSLHDRCRVDNPFNIIRNNRRLYYYFFRLPYILNIRFLTLQAVDAVLNKRIEMTTLKIIFKLAPWILLLLALLLWSLGVELPGKKGHTEIINATTVLEKVEALGRMELVRYKFREMYDYQSVSEGKLTGETLLKSYNFKPDLKAILIASGEAVGCIDLGKLKHNDVVVNGDTLYIRLPAPELCYHKLDLENTHVYHFERTGWWSRFFSNDEEVKKTIEKAYKNAEKQIQNAALEGGILEETNENARLILKPMLEKMSGKVVVLELSLAGQELNWD